MMETISRRNTDTFEAMAKDMYSKIYDVTTKINLLNASMGSISERLNNIEKIIFELKAKSIGNGPSVK